MKKLVTLISGITVVIALFLAAPCVAQTKVIGKEKEVVGKESTPRALVLQTNMQKLWEDNSLWTRNLIFCLVDDLPGLEQAKARLVQNQTDIGNTLKPYYGEAAGDTLAALLQTHVEMAVNVITAAKNTNTPAFEEAGKKWVANADEISLFLSNANPNLSSDDLKQKMREHLTLTTEQALQRIGKNYEADVLAFDKVRKGLAEIAEMLSAGIAKQFPEKFKSVAVK